ncbi:dynein axonemal heavy chain 12 [Chrysoperla carnea]|uniref:dynein axonemal heavy chain 12 n=1 Tax=Chrysoperla carnea TaxID=189513 RepID=UPI001D073DF2|nr:dynein axonemal heavy chain 12 [Chrysoperla carnea]
MDGSYTTNKLSRSGSGEPSSSLDEYFEEESESEFFEEQSSESFGEYFLEEEEQRPETEEFEYHPSENSSKILDECPSFQGQITDLHEVVAEYDRTHPYKFVVIKPPPPTSYLVELAKKNKARIDKLPPEKERDVVPHMNTSHRDIRSFSRKAPISRLPREWRKTMTRLLPQSLTQAYPQTAYLLYMEIDKQYWQANAQIAIDHKTLALPGEVVAKKTKDYRFEGRTEKYPEFVKIRAYIERELVILRPLFRKVFKMMSENVPESLVDFSEFKTNTRFTLEDLSLRIATTLWIEKNRVMRPYLMEVKKDILRTIYKEFKPITAEYIRYIHVTRKFIELRAMELLERTNQNCLAVLSNKHLMPYISFSLKYDGKLHLNPSLSEVTHFFRKILKTTESISIRYLPENLSTSSKKLPKQTIPSRFELNLPQFMIDSAKEKVDQNVRNMFEPVVQHMQQIETNFKVLFDEEMANEMEEFLNEDHTFEEINGKIEFFQEYKSKINEMDYNVFFDLGIVYQYGTIQTLHKAVDGYLKNLVKVLIEKNAEMNRQIYNEYESINKRALKVPESTAELVELGKYMTWVKQVYLAELQTQIKDSLQRMIRLADLTEITRDEIESCSETLTWIRKIKPILEAHNSMFEQRKAELEDILHDTIAQLEKNLFGLTPYLKLLDDMSDGKRARQYCDTLRQITVKIQDYERTVKWINQEEDLFNVAQSTFPDLEAFKNIIYPFYDLVFLIAKWYRNTSVWLDGPWDNLVIEDVDEKVEDAYKGFQNFQKTFRTKIRQQIVEKNPRRFKGSLEDKDINKQPAPLKLTQTMLQEYKNFRSIQNIITIMRNPALLQRHWDQMSELAGQDMTPNAGTTLRKIVDMHLDEFMENFEIISIAATKELALVRLLAKMKAEWVDVCFKTNYYKDSGVKILTQLDDVQAILDDHIQKTLSMRGSAFVKPIEQEVKDWYTKIDRTNKALDVWGKTQIQWCYLLPIFSSKDIVSQMPEEGALFKEVDRTYKRYMQAVERDPHVLEIASSPGLLEAFTECLKMLDKINEGVTVYLEKKRLYFPRFFFLSNDEMLEILSETKDPTRVQPHLRKCFEGIYRLFFDENRVIHSMFSQEGENVKLLDQIDTDATNGAVEKWLIQVESQMLRSIREEIHRSKVDYETKSRPKWVTSWEGQVVLCVSQIFWAKETEYYLRAQSVSDLAEYYEDLVKALNDIVRLVRSPEMSNLARITVKALIVIDVHAKDVIYNMVQMEIDNIMDFQWLSQLRYYWENDQAIVKVVNASVPYAYEYLGNSDRLVITPLTDRCYRTLVCAYQLHLNGAPEGPAGTGKTETTKDLAKALAVQCVVFNCSDGLDYKAMGKFFKGLASCGAWACFDEFNRIELEVLSVVAQQILCIIVAVRANVETFLFEGTVLKLVPSCYVCITMNPGYAGRSELPDNLKVLFRTVAMMVPDYALIGEISLYSYGFVDARKLSVKIVQTYRLCSEQLSSQNHYDYGMRAVKTVLSAAGNNKLASPDENEDIILLRSITDVNLPKFLSFDVPLFEGIISDLFPGIVLPKPDYSKLMTAFLEICAKKHIQPVPAFLEKIIQTYEMMIVRHGFMLVGEPFGGKTTCLQVLAESLSWMFETGLGESIVEYQIINPKSITMGQLYGQFDAVSYEWSDGVVATCYRNFAMDPSPNRKWVIFDGPVDAVWIENMNTVLDDNKKLCLMSGEVIAMTNVMSMIFEVMDLAQASPATVSRCGMIYSEAVNVGWEAIAQSWTETTNPIWIKSREEYIMTWLRFWIPPTLYFVQKYCVMLSFAGEINLVRSTLNLIEMLMNTAVEQFPEGNKHFNGWIQASLITSISWGIAGTLDGQSRIKFDEFFRSIWTGQHETLKLPLDVSISLPGDGYYLDYFYVYRMKGSWKYWPEEVKSMPVQESKSLQQTLVPTLDVARYLFLLKLHVKWKKRLLLIGPTGTGKTFYVQNFMMKKLKMDLYEPSFITFTVQISANQAQALVISKLNKWKRGIYGPDKEKEAVIFVDDINLPIKEIYGAQPPIELLRQYFDHEHWYDLKDTTKIFLHQLLFLAAMGPVGGSRQDIYHRFLRHFNIYSINEFSDESLFKIFTNTLMQGLRKNGFATDVMMSVMYIVNSTVDIYKQSIATLRPTPAKSHYIFNLRDFARVIQGCAMMRKETAGDEKSVFVRLWVHEVLRVFYDCLVEEEDRKWFFERIKYNVRENFKASFDAIFEAHVPKFDNQVTEESLKDLIFGVFLDLDSPPEERRYEEMPDVKTFLNVAENCLDDYNSSHKTKMIVVIFRYVLEHLSKVCRILSLPSGSGLLVGVGGSGRQSITRLAATICGFGIFQPEITKNYNLNEWREDIKRILKTSGGLGKDLVFLFNEGQIKEEAFLQDIDGLLNSGEVPNIYAIDEKQEILELTRLAAQGGNRSLDISALEVFSFFANRCKEKLHIILCFSPIGSALRTRLRLYPALVNCCTIDWFEGWPEDALEMVAERYMTGVNLPDDVKHNAVIICKMFHVDARDYSDEFYLNFGRKTYITSASYLDLIKSFTTLCNLKQEELLSNRNRYIIGLEQLAFAAEQVLIMQKDLEEFRPKLVEMAANCTEMMKIIETETAQVEQAGALVKKDEAIANIQAAEATELKNECQADLDTAMPIMQEATAALDVLNPSDITMLKSMKNPPEVIKVVMAAICVLKGIPPEKIPDRSTGRRILDYWGPSKRMLGDIRFLNSIKYEFDKDNIPPAIMQKIRSEYLTHPLLTEKNVEKASLAAATLFKWMLAINQYDIVAKIVAPKKEKLQEAEEQLNATMEILVQKQTMLKNLEERLADLNDQLTKGTAEMKRLTEEVQHCTKKLFRAEKLIGGLGGEKTRWEQAAEQLLQTYNSLAGDILVSCGIIAYLAPFTLNIRQKAIETWFGYVKQYKLPCSNKFSIREALGSDIKIQSWYIHGLPNDSFSTDNAIIMDSSKRCSLLIDPQRQANRWIRTMEKKNRLLCVKFTDGNYMKIIEHCIEFGLPVLIENILETLDAPIEPIIERKTYFQHGSEFIALGEQVLKVHKMFKLYLTTTLRNPHYLPEVFNMVTIINFALTIEGLEDQLLGIVVAKERPDLQELREKLIIESAENKSKLKEVETKILRTMSETEGNILDDQTAIDILDSSKKLSEDIIKKQISAKDTEEKIELSRANYKPMAKHSAVLYYTISELPNVDPMYQYSLAWFINLYMMSIANASRSNDLDKRLKFLINTFNYDLYQNVCRSLFEKDKLLYSFILYSKIMISKNKIDARLYMWFLTGGSSLKVDYENPASEWLNDTSWTQLCQIDEFSSSFTGLRESFLQNISAWHDYYDLTNPQDVKFPAPWNEKLNSFEKLILIRIIRPDKTMVSVSKLVAMEMGEKFVTPPPFDIAKSYGDSSSQYPLIFILSPGVDPMSSLQNFAEKMGFENKFKSISLGQGQGPIATQMIAEAQREEHWVCLQNCHLAVSWMPKLEKIVENFDDLNTRAGFRLWLTSYPSDKFPIPVLQSGVKMTNEPPQGLTQNILKSFTTEPLKEEEFYDGCPENSRTFHKLLYGLAFFHAIVQERRTYGSIGWNIAYGFNESDFQISVLQLQIFINEYPEVPYVAISYLVGECNYGGRVTDDWDRRCLNTILIDFLNPKIVDDPRYMFVNDFGPAYGVPKHTEYSKIIEFIEQLPSVHPPEVLGLHMNAGIRRDYKDSMMLIDSAVMVQGKGGSEGGGGEFDILGTIVLDILNKIPKPFDMEIAYQKYPTLYTQSMNTVLCQELLRFNKLLNVMHKSLVNINKANQGLMVMSPDLEVLAHTLVLGKIPAAWAKVSYPSLKSLSGYVTDFCERIQFLQKWIDNGKPDSFWLSGFYFTQAFLTSSKQNYARKYKIAIDQLVYDFEVLDSDVGGNPPPDDGVHCYGLFLEGARWNTNRYLDEQKPKVLYEPLPAVWLFPIMLKDYDEKGRYVAPLYKTSERKGVLSTTGHSTNYVLPFLLETKKPTTHWVKRSVALLCQLD